MALPIVLVVDSDLGFIVSLSYELHNRGIDSLPALTTAEARSMMMHLRREPDLLVINCAVPGACTLAGEVARVCRDVKIVGVVSEGNDRKNCADLLKATFRDPEDKAFEQIPYCANVIEALVRGQRSNTQTDSS